MSKKRLILASSSPDRLEILRLIGYVPDDVIPPNIDESSIPGELPRQLVTRLAGEKASVVYSRISDPSAVVLGSDTVVSAGRRIFGKPTDRADAEKMLCLFSGRRVRINSGLNVISKELNISRYSYSILKFKRLSESELNFFLDSDEWRGKAGGLATELLASCYIKSMIGHYYTARGLPVYEVHNCLQAAGIERRYPV